MQLPKEVESLLSNRANREILRYAVSRSMWCQNQRCQRILDVRRAVYVESHQGKPAVVCSTCYDSWDEHPVELDRICKRSETIDGRKLYSRPVPSVQIERTEEDEARARLAVGRCRSKRCDAGRMSGGTIWIYPRRVGDGRPSSHTPIGSGAPCPSCGQALKRTTWDASCSYRWVGKGFGPRPSFVSKALLKR